MKIKLDLSQESQWLSHFNDSKGKVIQLHSDCDNQEKKIDQAVYKLYNLTDEEISIVDNSI